MRCGSGINGRCARWTLCWRLSLAPGGPPTDRRAKAPRKVGDRPVAPDRPKHWRGFRGVLCPVDFSERSRLALRYADAIARRAHARLTVLYVNDPLLTAAAAAALHDRHLAERSRRELQTFVKATVRTRTQPQTCLGSGQPVNEILRIA